MIATLPWFLDLGNGALRRKSIRVKIDGPGPRTRMLQTIPYGGKPLQPTEIERTASKRWDNPDVMALHMLSVALRSIKLLEGLTGYTTKWQFPGSRLFLYSHGDKVSELGLKDSKIGKYHRGTGIISFEYIDDSSRLSACLSHDLVAHEICHAFLDGTKRWYGGSLETQALTETLGDFLALFSMARISEARRRALTETEGTFSGRSNVLSRFAELPASGAAIRDISKILSRAALDEAEDSYHYRLSLVLSSSLYEAMSRTIAKAGDPTEERLKKSVEELSGCVFGVVSALPCESVTFKEFVDEVLERAPDPLRSNLESCFEEQQVIGL